MMRVLILNEYTSIYGGTDSIVDMEISYLKNQGVDFKIFSFYNKQFLNASAFYKLKEYLCSCFPRRLVSAFQSEINCYHPDIIHFHNIYQIFRLPIWTQINPGGAKLILHLHNFYPFCLNSLMVNKGKFCTRCINKNNWLPGIFNRCYNNSVIKSLLVSIRRLTPGQWLDREFLISKFIVPSEFAASQYINLGLPSNKIEILPNPVVPESPVPGGDHVLFLGNIISEKGIFTFCESAAKLKRISFIAAGDGNELNLVRKKYKNLKNLKFTGFVSGKEKDKLIRGCRFLYYPTRCYETFGLAILEAFAYGKPVLTTGLGATSELVREGVTGLINPDNNIESQVHSIKRLWELTNSDSLFSKQCYEAASRFTVNRHINQLIKIYNQVIGVQKGNEQSHNNFDHISDQSGIRAVSTS